MHALPGGPDVIVTIKFDEAVIPAILFQKKSETIKVRAKVNNITPRRRGRAKVTHALRSVSSARRHDEGCSLPTPCASNSFVNTKER
eukprot:6217394-Amphidinium_carterae.1